jgi:two-component system phosphate regulon response regulator PhoB
VDPRGGVRRPRFINPGEHGFVVPKVSASKIQINFASVHLCFYVYHIQNPAPNFRPPETGFFRVGIGANMGVKIMAGEKILVVEDEEDIRELVLYNLTRDGFHAAGADSGESALRQAIGDLPDLMVLDWMLPGLSGLEVCQALRTDVRTSSIPIIMLTARGEEADIVAGLEAGADDYITKPFNPRVLIARIRAVLRRRETPGPSENIAIHDLVINPSRHLVKAAGEAVELTATEFALLLFFAQRPGWVFTRGQIIDAIKGEDYAVTDRAVDVQVLGLRKKLGPSGKLIETVRGVGYRLREP